MKWKINIIQGILELEFTIRGPDESDTLKHSFATHLLKYGTDLRYLQTTLRGRERISD